jgi:hypothetical protein
MSAKTMPWVNNCSYLHNAYRAIFLRVAADAHQPAPWQRVGSTIFNAFASKHSTETLRPVGLGSP